MKYILNCVKSLINTLKNLYFHKSEGENMSNHGLKRIIIHWTAGTGKANATDKAAYHFLVESDGKIITGKMKPEDNANCNDGKYAAHCGGGNTGSIGISMCGMHGFKANQPKTTNYPLTQIQCEACWSKVAQLCKNYGFSVTKDTVMTHYEFGKSHPNTSSARKIDITYLHIKPELKSDQIGDYIRGKVKWYLNNI